MDAQALYSRDILPVTDMKFVVCVNKAGLGDFSGDDLVVGQVYEVLEEADHGMVRVVDESGKDYLYPASCFDEVYDFSDAKRAKDVPGLARLQAEAAAGKARAIETDASPNETKNSPR